MKPAILFNLIKKSDRWIFGLVLGAAFMLFFIFTCFLIWFYLDRNENHVYYYLLAGLFAGLSVTVRFLKRCIDRRYELPVWSIITVYIFYNVCIFGFFMGVPVFIVLTGFIAGYYYGNKIHFMKIAVNEQKRLTDQVSLITGLIAAIFCISSAVIALSDPTTGKNLQGLMKTGREVSRLEIWAIIIFGGILLIVIQYLITKLTIKITLKSKTL